MGRSIDIDIPWKKLSSVKEIVEVIEQTRKNKPSSSTLVLNAIGNDLGDTGLENLLLGMGDVDDVKVMNLSCNRLSLRGVKALAKWISTKSRLKKLDLFGNDIDDAGVQVIALSMKHIQNLNLSYNQLGVQGAKALASSLSNANKLRILDLTGNERIGDEGSTVIGRALPDSKLRCLSLCRCQLSDDGTEMLARSLSDRRTRLQNLWIAENKIGKAGIESLIKSLGRNRRLKALDIRFNSSLGEKATSFIPLIRDCNSTLREVEVFDRTAKEQQQIDFWIELNASGRKLAQEEKSASLLPLVLQLVGHRADLVYGLITQTPHIWAAPSGSVRNEKG